MPSTPSRAARLAASAKSRLTRAMPSRSSAIGACSSSAWGRGDGASVRQPRGSSGPIWWPPSQGAWLDALRPAWASCTATGMGECFRIVSSTRPSAASVSSE